MLIINFGCSTKVGPFARVPEIKTRIYCFFIWNNVKSDKFTKHNFPFLHTQYFIRYPLFSSFHCSFFIEWMCKWKIISSICSVLIHEKLFRDFPSGQLKRSDAKGSQMGDPSQKPPKGILGPMRNMKLETPKHIKNVTSHRWFRKEIQKI